MVAMPATIGVNVRTIGMKRASTIDFGPWRSKKACALATFSALNSREFGRLNSAGPTCRPNT